MALKRVDNIGIVVDDLEATIDFFRELGLGRLELSRFITPRVVADHRNAPVNALGYLRVIMFTVDDIDDTLARLRHRGAQLVGPGV